MPLTQTPDNAAVRGFAPAAEATALAAPIWSDQCAWTDLCLPHMTAPEAQTALDAGLTWARKWFTTWSVDGSDLSVPVAALASVPLRRCVPVRHFTWATGQRHRPALQYMAATGDLHPVESHAEQRALLALEFAAGVTFVLSQPFTLSFTTPAGPARHIPDFLALTAAGPWLIDVKPASHIDADDHVAFAATAQAAREAAWHYTVVPGLRPQVFTNLDDLSAQRRGLDDRLGLIPQLLDAAAAGPSTFEDLAQATSVPTIARAFARHLLWHRRLGMDLAQPLLNTTVVYPVDSGDGGGRAGL